MVVLWGKAISYEQGTPVTHGFRASGLKDFFCFFFVTLVTGPGRSLSLKLSDTRVYEPQIRGVRRFRGVRSFAVVELSAPAPPRRYPHSCSWSQEHIDNIQTYVATIMHIIYISTSAPHSSPNPPPASGCTDPTVKNLAVGFSGLRFRVLGVGIRD